VIRRTLHSSSPREQEISRLPRGKVLPLARDADRRFAHASSLAAAINPSKPPIRLRWHAACSPFVETVF
jgi:hypothetical protein